MNSVTQEVLQKEWVESPVAVVEAPVLVAELLGQPVKSAEYVEQYGRVATVRFEPLFATDPVLPVFVGTVTDKAKELFSKLTFLMLRARELSGRSSYSNTYDVWKEWYKSFNDYSERFVAAVARELAPDEIGWMRQQFKAIASQPLNYL